MTIHSKAASPEYLSNWDRIFGKKEATQPETSTEEVAKEQDADVASSETSSTESQ